MTSKSTWDWRYRVNGAAECLVETNPMTNSDFSPETVAVALARDLLLDEETLMELTEVATGKRYEVIVAPVRGTKYVARSCLAMDTNMEPFKEK